MAKPRVITRAMRLLEEAAKVKIATDGTVRVLGHANDKPPWGLYAIIPLTDVDAMVSALARADARETRDDPSTRKRNAKPARLVQKRRIRADGSIERYLGVPKRKAKA